MSNQLSRSLNNTLIVEELSFFQSFFLSFFLFCDGHSRGCAVTMRHRNKSGILRPRVNAFAAGHWVPGGLLVMLLGLLGGFWLVKDGDGRRQPPLLFFHLLPIVGVDASVTSTFMSRGLSTRTAIHHHPVGRKALRVSFIQHPDKLPATKRGGVESSFQL